MSSFTEARLEKTDQRSPRGVRYRAVRGAGGTGFRYYVGFIGSSLYVEIREGFLTDGPSGVPGPILKLLSLLRLLDHFLLSCAVHDGLREDERFALIETDAIFLCAMRAEGTWPPLREIAFFLVRLNRGRYKHNPPPDNAGASAVVNK